MSEEAAAVDFNLGVKSYEPIVICNDKRINFYKHAVICAEEREKVLQ